MAKASDENYLTTAEVAARLKVKPETVYAYVSRGLLTSVRARGRRGSLFAESDVERLASRSVDHPGAIERIESSITLIRDDELYYRGHRARTLATTQTVEAVAHLLWTGELPASSSPVTSSGRPPGTSNRTGGSPGSAESAGRPAESAGRSAETAGRSAESAGRPAGSAGRSAESAGRPAARGSEAVGAVGRGGGVVAGKVGAPEPVASEAVGSEAVGSEAGALGGRGVLGGFPVVVEMVGVARRGMGVAPVGARLTDKVRIAVAALGAGDPLRFDLSAHSVEVAAGRLLGSLVAALPGPAGEGSFGARLWPKLTSTRPARPELLDAAVILLADHGLAVSTIAARVAASARANLYAVVSAGLGALDGHLHGAATTLAYEFLGRAVVDPVAALSDHLRSGEPVPGFGHKLYRERDPRAEVLLELIGENQVTETVQELTARLPGFPNSDLAVAALMHSYDFRPDAGEALFAIARIIGWTAHALEEYAQPPLRFRPLGVYAGPDVPAT